MKVRIPFAVVFIILILLSGYMGLAKSLHFDHDKIVHFLVFFILALDFYWIFDATRKQCMNFTGVFIGGVGGIGSEVLQSVVSAPDRQFDPLDILFNLLGCILAIVLCSWYHNRLLQRRRNTRYKMLRGDNDVTAQAANNTAAEENNADSTELFDLESQQPTTEAEPSK